MAVDNRMVVLTSNTAQDTDADATGLIASSGGDNILIGELAINSNTGNFYAGCEVGEAGSSIGGSAGKSTDVGDILGMTLSSAATMQAVGTGASPTFDDLTLTGDGTISGGGITLGAAAVDGTITHASGAAADADGRDITITAGSATTGTSDDTGDGGDVIIQGGAGKGTEDGGSIIFKSATKGVSAATLNSIDDTILTLDSDKGATFAGAVTGITDLTITGNLNITGDINSTSVTDLDVTDKTITIAKGAADSSAADGAGIVVDGASASLLYDHTGLQWEFNKPLEVTGHLLPGADDTYDLGSTSLAWSDLNLEGDVVMTDAGAVKATAGALTIDSEAAGLVLDGHTGVTIDSTSSGSVDVNSVGAINVGNDNVDQAINVGTGGTRTLSIGIDDGTDLTTTTIAGHTVIDKNNAATTATTLSALHVDYDKSGVTANSTAVADIGINLDMNDAATNHSGSTVSMVGIDMDIVSANASGTLTNTGLNVAVSGADTNYPAILSGGNVGIENAAPGSQLEISKVSGRASLELSSWSATATAAHAGVLKFQKSGTATVNTFTGGDHTTAGEILGRLEAYGVDDADGATLSSYIEFANDAISNGTSSPGKIVFATSDADDAGSPTVRMTIDDDGLVTVPGAMTVSGTLTATVANATAAATVTIADAANDTTTFPLLGTAATGTLAPATDSSLTYNANTGYLTATGLSATTISGGTF